MTVKDVSSGPAWIIWVIFALFALISLVLLTGHGANLIAGYNTASEEEKSRYDAKKLCRVTGAGMAVIAVLILIMGIGESVLPAAFSYVFFAAVVIDCIVIIVLANTICRK